VIGSLAALSAQIGPDDAHGVTIPFPQRTLSLAPGERPPA
jgi:hypothetical protein